MKITAIIPTFNRATLVSDAINSILNQTYSIDEIIVIDDGSTDNTQDILKKFHGIKIIKTKNLGVSHARNTGIRNAKNNWLAFLDSDDIWLKDKAQKQVALHNKDANLMFSHTGERWLRDGKEIKYPKSLTKPQGDCFLQNISTCKIAASSVLINKKVFDTVGLFNESLSVCEDYDMWLRILYDYQIALVKSEGIIKKAGHSQLSSTIFAIDRYHIYTLQKFLGTRFSNEVKDEIIRKSNILVKGAIKHNNQEILKQYLKVIRDIQN